MVNALIGGLLIGLAASLMMLFNGRVTGISGILAGIVQPKRFDVGWRVSFISGLVIGGVVLSFFRPEAFIQQSSAQWGDYIFAGLLVGFGTLLGNGCTSGHGVCGISRMSVRSIMATVTFILFGMLSLLVFKILRGSL
jgi:uncharacterized membrane protein YedE/YeeE